MSRRHEINDAQWLQIRDHLRGQPHHRGVTVSEEDNRRFINAIFYVAKTGIPWRDLPERFGNWNSVFVRFNRWAKQGLWQRIFELVQDPDLEWLLLDATIIRVHQHAAGAKKTTKTPKTTSPRIRPSDAPVEEALPKST